MTALPYAIEPQQSGDAAAIETLLDQVFGHGRLAKTSYQYRWGVPVAGGLSFVARGGGKVLGTIRFWPVLIGGNPETAFHNATPVLLLGPLAVAPERINTGIGGALIGQGLAAARAQGHGVILLVGDEDYYGRFGFTPAEAHGIHMKDEPGRLLVREILPDALAGVQGPVQPRRWVRPGLNAA